MNDEKAKVTTGEVIFWLPIIGFYGMCAFVLGRGILIAVVASLLVAFVGRLLFPRTKWFEKLLNCGLVLGLIGLVSPLDITVRVAPNGGIKFLQVVRIGETRLAVTRLNQEGFKELEDYVGYSAPESICGPYWAVVIVIEGPTPR